MPTRVYEYEGCSTCRKALQFLEKKRIAYERIPIVDRPPTRTELKKMLGHLGGNLRKLFNTSGLLYREMKIGEKLESLSESDALALLASHGKLVKRPFLLTQKGGAVGFKEEEWKKLLLG